MHPNMRALITRLTVTANAVEAMPTTMAQSYTGQIPGQGKPVVDDRFKGKGNTRFVPLSKDYAKKKKAEFGKKPILVRTGLTRSAVLKPHVIKQSGDLAVISFANLPDYADYQHTGVPWRNLPMRSPVQPNEADIIRVEAAAVRSIRNAWKQTSPGKQSHTSGKVTGA